MKIGINQPNGFTTNFANDSSKYIDTKQPSKYHLTQFKIKKVNSIHIK